ncbi:MarR family winged helix-turn-helix transcriptional regulator [Streptomyces sp. TP-A0874]|uniref:MarR family winged helix-turn-helix transcriptional regulator n=1 Tax=Streptomyces sp. TP-A0874 TaxID=549819 RepID=UPI00147D1AB9|nr:MarR family transcriptional regulator [Streptomyces sp. TP-A0874]
MLRTHVVSGDRLFSEIDLAPPQDLILLHLQEYGPLRQSDIVGFLQRDRSTVSSTLKAMERAGLVRRTPVPADRRVREVSLTEAGRSLCPAIRRLWAELEEMAFSHLTPDGRALLVDTLDASREALVTAMGKRAQAD